MQLGNFKPIESVPLEFFKVLITFRHSPLEIPFPYRCWFYTYYLGRLLSFHLSTTDTKMFYALEDFHLHRRQWKDLMTSGLPWMSHFSWVLLPLLEIPSKWSTYFFKWHKNSKLRATGRLFAKETNVTGLAERRMFILKEGRPDVKKNTHSHSTQHWENIIC